MYSSGSTLNLLQYFGISAKLPRTASRPRKMPPFGSVSGVSHSTLSANCFPTPSKSPLLKSSYAARATSTFAADIGSPSLRVRGPSLLEHFVRGGLHAETERVGRRRRLCCFARDPSVSAATELTLALDDDHSSLVRHARVAPMSSRARKLRHSGEPVSVDRDS